MASITKCNMCGKVFGSRDFANGISIMKYFGYGSEYDGDEIQLDLCCDCTNDIISQCVINPIIDPEKTSE